MLRSSSTTWAAAFASALVVGYLSILSPLVAVGALGAALLFFVTHARPELGMGFWLAVVLFVPEWTRVSALGIGLRPYQAVAVPVLVALLTSPQRARTQIIRPDLFVAAWVVLAAGFTAVGILPNYVFFYSVTALGLGYLMGRLAGDRIRDTFPVMVAVVAVWGIVEFLTGWHAFANWMLSPSHTWNLIQTRSGLVRAEATMGHAIAFGATCAAAIPFAVRRGSKVLTVILVAGVLVSLSRGPLLALVSTLALVVFYMVRSRSRTTAVLGLVAIAGVVYYMFLLVYSGDDADYVERSGEQRLVQLRGAFDAVRFLSPAITQSAAGGYVVGSVDTIDSTPLRFATNYGWVGALLLIIPFAIVASAAISRRVVTPATIALAGQIPVLLVTSMITQWQVVVMLLLGMAVSDISKREGGSGRELGLHDGADTRLSADRRGRAVEVQPVRSGVARVAHERRR